MIINSLHITFAPKDADTVEPLLRELRDASRKEPGVVQYDVFRGVKDPNVFAFWEFYRDEESFQAHIASEHFQRIFANNVRSLVQDSSVQRVAPI